MVLDTANNRMRATPVCYRSLFYSAEAGNGCETIGKRVRSYTRMVLARRLVVQVSFGEGLGGKPKSRRLNLGPAHPHDLALGFNHWPVFPCRANDVEPVQHFCNFLGTSAVPKYYPIPGFPGS